jgi:small subunit ribosomal protein S18
VAEETRDFQQESRPEQRRGRPPQGRRYSRRPRVCQFCADHSKVIDYKKVDLLKRFVNEQKKIRPRRETGTCSKHQRLLARAIKNARHIALLPFTAERWR